MENGKGNGRPREEGTVIHANFTSPSDRSDTIVRREISDNVRGVADLFHDDLARPAMLSSESSIPPRAPEAQVIKLGSLKRRRVKRTVFAGRRQETGKTRECLKLNDWLMREKATPTIESITGGTREQVSTENMAEENKRAKEHGYEGVRKMYLMIKNTIPQESETAEEPVDYDQRASQIAEKIKVAVQELEKFYSFRDEDDEPIYTDNPRDPRLFNAVASILIRVWGHNYLTKLNDMRVNTIVLLLNRGDVSWRKLIDLMVEWEKTPSVAKTVNRHNI